MILIYLHLKMFKISNNSQKIMAKIILQIINNLQIKMIIVQINFHNKINFIMIT